MTTRKQHGVPIVGLLLTCAILGCGGSHDISIALDFDVGHDRSQVVTHFVAVYEDDNCGFVFEGFPVPMFTIETNVSLRRHLQFFEGDGGDPIGELEPGTYTFVALGLDDVCLPEFIGCSVETLGDSSEVSIEMDETTNYIPFCGLLGTCNDGRCSGY